MTASARARSWWAARRARALVIHLESPVCVAILPSRLSAALAMTNGLPVVIHLLKAELSCVASVANNPASHRIPARRNTARPRPLCRGLGSRAATTTRRIPAAMMAAVQGGVRPSVQHGSSVTYNVAPRALPPARAKTSACGPPACLCQPRPMIWPARTTTAPTTGLGLVRPLPRRANASACCMKS